MSEFMYHELKRLRLTSSVWFYKFNVTSPAMVTTVYSTCNATNPSSQHVYEPLDTVVWYKPRPPPVAEGSGKAGPEDKVEVPVEVKVEESEEESEGRRRSLLQ